MQVVHRRLCHLFVIFTVVRRRLRHRFCCLWRVFFPSLPSIAIVFVIIAVIRRRFCRLCHSSPSSLPSFCHLRSRSPSPSPSFFVVFDASFSKIVLCYQWALSKASVKPQVKSSLNASRSPSSLQSFCHLCHPSPSSLSSSPSFAVVFAILRHRLCQLFVSIAIVFVIFDASFSHLCRPSPSSLSSSPSFAIVFIVVFVVFPSFAVIFAVLVVVFVVRRRLRRHRRLRCPSVIVAKKRKTKNTKGPHISGPQFTHRSAVAVRMFSVRKLHVRRSASLQVRSPHFTRAHIWLVFGHFGLINLVRGLSGE